jgi:hypothetical protein
LELIGKKVQGTTTYNMTIQQNLPFYFLMLFLTHRWVTNMARKFLEVWDGFEELQMLVVFNQIKKTIHVSVPEV